MGLTFQHLRRANVARLPVYKNSKGDIAHPHANGGTPGFDWTPAQWLQAVVGELGEYANFRKKFERGDITQDEFDVQAAKELADVQIYLDILAYRLGIDLGEATRSKFNEVSRRVGCTVFIP
jgi:NTP pyrophosphatase (non-canonical NTP hydrolase)